jgi:hypothetical protein
MLLLERSDSQPDQADAGEGGYTNHGLHTLRAQGDAATTKVDFVV